MRKLIRLLCCSGLLLGSSLLGAEDVETLRIAPSSVRVDGPEASEQLLVWGNLGGREWDRTTEVVYTSYPEGIVLVSALGQVTPLRDGHADITVQHGVKTSKIPVDVSGVTSPVPVSFRRDIVPILSKAGCNAGGCHGKAEGQNGFKLSVFGFDPAADYQALTMEAHGRRVSRTIPTRSLLLLKASGTTPHGGGRKIEPGSRWQRRVERWIAEGARFGAETDAVLTGIEVEPRQITLDPLGSQQLRVVAVSPMGERRCVTAECDYQSNQDVIAGVDSHGRITATDLPGEAAVLVRYQGQVAVCRVTRPQVKREFVRPAETNLVDRHVWNKLDQLGIPVSPVADDATYLRRVALDMTGTLPTADEARAFLCDTSPDKRQRLVESLFQRSEYADYWAQRWGDLLQIDKDVITPQGAVAMTRWVRQQIERNVPYDQFVRSILMVEGTTLAESPAGFYQVQKDPEKLARSVSQLFLGVRIECAQYHHHPFERWDQRDYVVLAGFFTRVDRRMVPTGRLKIVDKVGADVKHRRSEERTDHKATVSITD
jgi:Protein of unknown function (DUF1549)